MLGMVAGLWMMNVRIAKAPTDGKACTQEAKLCPDGSAALRTGPHCEFAACPFIDVPATSATTTLAIGANATINSTTIGVLDLVEDSRCPVDVQCIQAGTVRVRASIDSYSLAFTFTLGQPQVLENTTITLVSVIPEQKYAKQTVKPSDYRFTFTVMPKMVATPSVILSSGSGVRGKVLLGPTCPVERIPPDPACAPKLYATAIMVYRAGSKSPFVIGNSNASGAFEFSLPTGSYTLVAKGGTVLPRCNDVNVTIVANAYATADISCDTGIR
jgi:hypothetical protein